MILLTIPLLLFGEKFRTVTLETPEGAREPQVAVQRSTTHIEGTRLEEIVDNVYVAFGTRESVHVSISRDSGATFERSRSVGKIGSLALGLRRGPRIVAAGETVMITAIAGEKGGGRDGDVVSWHSTNRGATWIDDGRVNEVPGSAREGLHAMAVGSKDEVFCVWIDLGKDAPRICGASSSSDHRGRWSRTRVVFGDPDGICPCCHPSVAFDAKGRLYVMWRGHDRDSRDMVVAWSDDLGETFSKSNKLGTGTWKLDACPMDGGAIDVGGGTLRSVWRRESSIFRAELTGSERKLGDGEQPWLVYGEDGEYAVWLARRGGPLMLLLPRAKESIRLDDHANDPVLAAGSDLRRPVFAAWESGTSDAPRIVIARLHGGTDLTSR